MCSFFFFCSSSRCLLSYLCCFVFSFGSLYHFLCVLYHFQLYIVLTISFPYPIIFPDVLFHSFLLFFFHHFPLHFLIFPFLHNLPTSFRIYPPSSFCFTKNRFWGRWTVLYLFGSQKRRFWQQSDFGEIEFKNDRLKLKSTLIQPHGTTPVPFNNNFRKHHVLDQIYITLTKNK